MTTVYFEDLVEGQEYVSLAVMVDKDEMLEYARKNDPWPFHVDEEAAQASPFGGLIASGGYAISLYYRLGHLLHNTADSKWAFLGGFDWHVSFLRPIRPGDRLRRKTVVRSKRLSSKSGRGVVDTVGTLINGNDEEVLRIEVASLIATRPSA
jgi:acyl dehydratase